MKAANKEIAERLAITEGTVKNHVSDILAKLQAENRTQAADIARRHGLAWARSTPGLLPR